MKCPDTYAALRRLLRARPAGDVDTILRRLRVVHHWSLSLDNRQKMIGLIDLLLERLVRVCVRQATHAEQTATATASGDGVAAGSGGAAGVAAELDLLATILFELTQELPEAAARAVRRRARPFWREWTRRRRAPAAAAACRPLSWPPRRRRRRSLRLTSSCC